MTPDSVTRRLRYQERKAAGLCVICGGKHGPRVNASHCERCRRKDTAVVRKRNAKLREAVYAAYGGALCACCGEVNPAFLTLDHVNNDGAEQRRRLKTTSTEALMKWAIKNNFPPVLQVLCFNCNCGRHRNGGVCPHKETVNE